MPEYPETLYDIVSTSVSFPGVTIRFDPPHVEIDTSLDWTGAAKLFWNEVARLIGQEPPFGW